MFRGMDTKKVLCRFNFTRYWSAEYRLIGRMFTNDLVCRSARYFCGMAMEEVMLRSFTVGMWEWLSFDSEEMGWCVEICCWKYGHEMSEF